MGCIAYIKSHYKKWLNLQLADKNFPSKVEKINRLALINASVPMSVTNYCWLKSGLKLNTAVEPISTPEDISDDDNLYEAIDEADRLITDEESDDDLIILEPVADELTSQSSATAIITRNLENVTLRVPHRRVLTQPKITSFMKWIIGSTMAKLLFW